MRLIIYRMILRYGKIAFITLENRLVYDAGGLTVPNMTEQLWTLPNLNGFEHVRVLPLDWLLFVFYLTLADVGRDIFSNLISKRILSRQSRLLRLERIY